MTILPVYLRPILGGDASGVCVSQDSDVYLHIDLEQLTHDAPFSSKPPYLLGSGGFRTRQSGFDLLTHGFLKHGKGCGQHG